MAKTIILEERQLEFQEGTYGQDGLLLLEENATYIVVWNNAEYVCNAYRTTLYGDEGIFVGNEAFVKAIANGDESAEPVEPFIIVDGIAYNSTTILAFDESTYNTVAIYQVNENEGLVIRNPHGEAITYGDYKMIALTKPDGTKKLFTAGEAVETTVELNFSQGDMQVIPDKDKLFSQVSIQKPVNLTAENIVKDVEIAGIIGEHECGGDGGDKKTEADIIMNTLSGSYYYNPYVTTIPNTRFGTENTWNTSTKCNVAFYDFPNCLTIGGYAFANGSILEKINAPNVTSIGNYAFYRCSSLSEASFPQCTSIGEQAFYQCQSLECADLPLITSIPVNAFYNCSNLKSVNIPLVSTIGQSAFYNCSNLKSVNAQITGIQSSAFKHAGLVDVEFSKCTFIGSSAFENCKSLKTVSLPECKTVYSGAFQYCYKLESVYLPKCQILYDYAFYQCSALKEISLPECTSVSSRAFFNILSLSKVELPKCSYIGTSAFYNCSALTSISIPVCTSIITNAFYGCESLQSIDLPLCNYVGGSAFGYCISLESITMPNVISIYSWAFQGCSALQSVNLSSCNYLGSGAFYLCINLESVNMLTAASIYTKAFGCCRKLTTLTLMSDTITTLLSSDTFMSTPIVDSSYTGAFGSIYVPASLVDSYKVASYWSYYADRITAIEE